jgi:hypothetical protein
MFMCSYRAEAHQRNNTSTFRFAQFGFSCDGLWYVAIVNLILRKHTTMGDELEKHNVIRAFFSSRKHGRTSACACMRANPRGSSTFGLEFGEKEATAV